MVGAKLSDCKLKIEKVKLETRIRTGLKGRSPLKTPYSLPVNGSLLVKGAKLLCVESARRKISDKATIVK